MRGEVFHWDRRLPAKRALAAAGLAALVPQEKEGIALVNGTVVTEAYALQAVVEPNTFCEPLMWSVPQLCRC